jgi:hypothetical protein
MSDKSVPRELPMKKEGSAISINVERALGAPSWRLYVCRAMDAVRTLSAGLPGMQLSPEAREELALQLAELMGRLDRLLSMLHKVDGQAVGIKASATDAH